MAEQFPIEANFQVYHDLMAKKVREILLVSSPYDAFLMEEDGSLASRIINEYQGLNLSHPPRLHRASSGKAAMELLERFTYDLVITMPQVDDTDAVALSATLRAKYPDLPVIFLAHNARAIPQAVEEEACVLFDKQYIWSADPDFLLAIVKNVEDHHNVEHDTRSAQVRVLLLVEDSPLYRSYLLPLVYREVVHQTQAVLAESLNEEHRLLKMRARPKVLVVENYEDALDFYHRYRPYLMGVITDMRFPRNCKQDPKAGLKLLKHLRRESPDLPLLMLSSGAENQKTAEAIPALFIHKNAQRLSEEIQNFFLDHLGFGDFVFRLPDNTVVDWAKNLREFEDKLSAIPDKSLIYHAKHNHFANWIMARSEVPTAQKISGKHLEKFKDVNELRAFLTDCLHSLRRTRQCGIVTQFNQADFDPDVVDFVRVGRGSLGGKARGLAFMAQQLLELTDLPQVFHDCPVVFPKTLVIASGGFDTFVEQNWLRLPDETATDEEIAAMFMAGELPSWLLEELSAYLEVVEQPLAVRSSSLSEDAHYKPYAGLFHTEMLANNEADFPVRLEQLVRAIKLIYASTWFAGPRAFARREGRNRPDSMAIIIQELVGTRENGYFYPAISGVAQSYNYYPVGNMRPEDGVAHIALGMGRTVVEGERSLRFSPKFPKALPQFATVDDTLKNSQTEFYALSLEPRENLVSYEDTSGNLTKLALLKREEDTPVQLLCSTYFSDEHSIRDTRQKGRKVLTFASILKYKTFPLAEMLRELTAIGKKAMGTQVEIEFAVDLREEEDESRFYFLQIRPMVAGEERFETTISTEEEKTAFCYSSQALGHGVHKLKDIVFVRPDDFDPAATREIAAEISKINRKLQAKGSPYLLIGPGRWGSADPWLGIPVQWLDISGVGAMVELRGEGIHADPSEGSHFFQNITSLGIPYVTVNPEGDRLDWQWLNKKKKTAKTKFLTHLRLTKPITIKIDWSKNSCVMLKK